MKNRVIELSLLKYYSFGIRFYAHKLNSLRGNRLTQSKLISQGVS